MVEDSVLRANSEKRTGETQESERYRFLLENLPDVAWTTDQEGRTVFISPNVTRVYGYSPEEIYEAGDSLWFGRIHATDRSRVQEAFQGLFRENKAFDIEYRIQRKDGNWIWLHDRSVSVYEKNGMRYADGLFSDITERKRMEKEIKDLARFPSENPNPTLRIDKDGTVISVNEASKLILQDLTAGQAAPKFWRDLTAGVLLSGQSRDVDVESGGRLYSFLVKPNMDEKYANLYGSDITERRRGEEMLRESISLLRATLDSTADGILVIDRKGKVTSFNRRFAELWRIPESILQTGNSVRLREFVADQLENSEQFLASTQALYDEPERESFDVLKYKDGRVFERYSQPQRVEEQIVGRVWSFRDVTKRRQAEEALRLSEAKYRALVDNASDFIFSIGKEDEIIAINPAGARFLGKTVGEVLGKRLHDVYPKEIATAFSENAKEVLLTGKGKTTDERIVLGENELWINTRLEPLLDDRNNAYAITGVARDITQRKRMEDELQRYSNQLEQLVQERTNELVESEKRFRELADLLPQIVFEVDGKGDVLYLNRAGFVAAGCTEEEFRRGLNAFEMFAQEDHDRAAEDIRRTMSGETRGARESTVLRRDGSTFPVLVYTAPMVREGKAMGVRGIAIDITERKRKEEELLAIKERLEFVVTSNPAVIFTAKPLPNGSDYILTYLSKRVMTMLGYPPEDFVGHPDFWECHVPPEDVRRIHANMPRLWKERRSTDEYRFLHKNGTYCWIREEANVIYGDDGKPIEVNGYWTDVTERKRMEARLAGAERLAAIGESSAMIGHDLRNPLQGIATTLYLAKKKLESPRAAGRHEAKRLLDVIHGEIYYMDKIVSDLQDYAAPLTPQFSMIDTGQLVRKIVPTVTIPKNIQVTFTTKDIPKAELDEAMMKRVFTNLITNAIQSMPNGGRLAIKTSTEGGELIVSFRDTGAGISEENFPKLFSPFFTTKAKGQGLGLAVSKRLLEAQGGTVTVRSKVGEGSTFTVRLPLKRQ